MARLTAIAFLLHARPACRRIDVRLRAALHHQPRIANGLTQRASCMPWHNQLELT